MHSSESDSDSDWNTEFLTAVSKNGRKGTEISEQSRCEQMRECLDQGADVNTKGKNGNTALHMAVKKGYQEIVQFLRQHRARIDIRNQQDHTAITLAEYLDQKEIASILKEPFEQQSEQVIPPPRPRVKYSPVDDARPSTSREGTFLLDDHGNAKRKLNRDDEYDKTAKWPRLTMDDPLQFERQSHVPDDAPSEGTSFSGDRHLGGNTERINEPAPFDSKETYAASGLKRSLHGVVYQWKHLMLILHRAWKMRYSFRLATEMDAAEKFDDVVLEYEESPGNKVHRFVQLKHKQEETEYQMVSVSHLLDVKDGEFSMLKYFISWRKIKQNSYFGQSRSKKFFLCTNIGLDVEGLKSKNIHVSEVGGFDQFLNFSVRTERPPRFYKLLNKSSELCETMKLASDVHRLAKELAEQVFGSKNIYLNTDILKCYHIALAQEVIDIKNRRFFHDFIQNNNLSPKVRNFREILFLNTKQLSKKNESDKSILNSLKNKTLNLSSNFGKKLKSTTDSHLTQFTELPDDKITDAEISNFLDELILAVNQPNEIELGELIKNEIGAYSQFNLLNVDFIGESFQKAILDWLKKTGKYSKFLGNQDADDFFVEIERELSSLITVGLNLPYSAELKSCDIKFRRENEDLKKFLRTSNSTQKPILVIISYEQTLLTALRVYQTLEQLEKYKKNDSLIFIHLEKLLLPDIMSQVVRAFESSRSHNLLVIDCESIGLNPNVQMLWKRFCDIMKLKRNGNKRMILIIQGNNSSVIQFEIGFETSNERDDDISIDNLTYSSRQKLLKKMIVKFQGHEEKTSFGKLLNTRIFDDNIAAETVTAFGPIIDSKTLVQLIQGAEIRIGGEIKGLSDIKDFYISRTIVRQVIIEKHILKAPGITDLFVFSGIDRRTLEKLVTTDENIRSFRENSQTEIHLNECVILDKNRETDDFRIICERNSSRNIHWLHVWSGKLIWKQSVGNITNLITYKAMSHTDTDHNEPGVTYLTQDRLVDDDEQRKIVIISDRAGMGKTTVLTYLARKIKQNKSGLLVIMIELPRHTTVLAEEQAKRTFDGDNTKGAVDFLVDKLSSLSTHLEREAFKAIIRVRGEAVLLFDGFDEISPTYEKIVIDLLQALTKLRIKKLYVTTRPHTGKELEKKLGMFSHTLQPFSASNQIEFLTKFWRRGLSSNDFNERTEENLKKHAIAVLKILTTSINRRMQEFTGVPLQTRLVAEDFPYLKTGKAISDSENIAPKLPEKIDLIDLYKRFVDEKYSIFCKEKKQEDQTNPAGEHGRKVTQRMFLMSHQKLALDALFDGDTARTLLSSQPEIEIVCSLFQDRNDAEERTGIVTQVVSGKPYFVHRTFAEYFAATFLINTLAVDSRNREVRKFFVAQLFVEPEHKTIRAFLNCLLSNGSCTLDNKSWEFDLSANCDADHRTLYHVAADESNIEIVRFFINRLDKNSLKQESDINLRDKSGLTALAIAMDRLCNLDVVKCFADGGADLNCKCVFSKRPLHIAAEKPENLDVVQYLIGKGANLNSQDQTGKTPLHNAVSAIGNLEIVKYLIEKGAHINSLTNNGRTPLHNAVIRDGNLDVVKHLVDRGADIDCQNDGGYTALYYATIRSIDVAKYLIEKGAGINSQRDTGMTVLHYSTCVPRQLDMTKHLVENGADIHCQTKDGYTPLYYAVIHARNLDVVKYLVERGADVNFQQQTGMTPLHYAAIHAGDLDIVKYLIEKGADINCRNKDGYTPLYYAAFQDTHLGVVKFLIEKHAGINTQGEHDKTPLHNAAAAIGNFNMVKYLIEKGADVNSRETSGLTPLYHAAGVDNNFDVLKLLIERGAQVNFQGERGDSPLHNAALIDGNLHSVKYLTEKGANVNFKNEHGKTPLHNAALIGGNLDSVKYLIDNDANINSQDEDGKSPLHNAAGLADNFNIVKYLIENSANFNSQDINGLTPLYYAAGVDHNSDTGKYLVDRGADISPESKNGETPLHNAALAIGNLDLVKYLVEKGANVNSKGENGKTPLHNAVLEECNLDLVKYLIERGANVNSPDEHGKTPLHNAATVADNFDIVNHLIDKGATIDSREENGLTPLYYAAGVYNNSDVVKHLIEKGADVSSQGLLGDTPLHNAALTADNLDSVKCLVERGADVNSEGEHGKTPLHNASGETGNFDMVEYLIQKGANYNSQDMSGLTPLNYAAGADNNLAVVKYLIARDEIINS